MLGVICVFPSIVYVKSIFHKLVVDLRSIYLFFSVKQHMFRLLKNTAPKIHIIQIQIPKGCYHHLLTACKRPNHQKTSVKPKPP